MYILDVRIRTSCEVLIVLMDSLIGLYRLEARVGILINIVYSASMKSYQYRNFDISEKYIIQLFGYCYFHVSGQRQAVLER